MEEFYAISIQREEKKSSLYEEIKETRNEITKESIRSELEERERERE